MKIKVDFGSNCFFGLGVVATEEYEVDNKFNILEEEPINEDEQLEHQVLEEELINFILKQCPLDVWTITNVTTNKIICEF